MDAKVKAQSSPETHHKKRKTEKRIQSPKMPSTKALGSQRRVTNQFHLDIEKASKMQYRDFRPSSISSRKDRMQGINAKIDALGAIVIMSIWFRVNRALSKRGMGHAQPH